ncbi:hypothetical protein BAE44_0013266 [Dichanthelium oligosanthes]|uniref:Uncharacterized protein n=1 Tax=Dichanthelium oligosanthes TaxID=888268 RepID=A0A1E5VKW5_9POAL|nr:hypothetical protein BAE44_0013266 [Dichanthelium oligosanthes]
MLIWIFFKQEFQIYWREEGKAREGGRRFCPLRGHIPDLGTSPRIEEIAKRVQSNKSANDDFLRSWLMIAVSTFLCVPTGLAISPRCYLPLVNLSQVKDLNWCLFVVDQLHDVAKNTDKKNSVKGCLLLLVVLYADSLELGSLQVPATKPRVAAWDMKLLDGVINMDTNNDGSFGKLNKKRKICATVSKVLSGVTELMRTFVQEICEINDETKDAAGPSLRRSKRNKITHQNEDDFLDEDTSEDSDYKEEDRSNYGTDDDSLNLDPEELPDLGKEA